MKTIVEGTLRLVALFQSTRQQHDDNAGHQLLPPPPPQNKENKPFFRPLKLSHCQTDEFEGEKIGVLYGSKVLELPMRKKRDESKSDIDVICTLSFFNQWKEEYPNFRLKRSLTRGDKIFHLMESRGFTVDFVICLKRESGYGLVLGERDSYKSMKFGRQELGVMPLHRLAENKWSHLYFPKKWEDHVNSLHNILNLIPQKEVSMIMKGDLYLQNIKEETRALPPDSERLELGEYTLTREKFEAMSVKEKLNEIVIIARAFFNNFIVFRKVVECICISKEFTKWISDAIIAYYPLLSQMDVKTSAEISENDINRKRDLSLPSIQQDLLPFPLLPRDLNFMIFSSSFEKKQIDVYRLRRVCKRWNGFFSSHHVWRYFYSFQFEFPVVTLSTICNDWIEAYKMRCKVEEEVALQQQGKRNITTDVGRGFIKAMTLDSILHTWNRIKMSYEKVDLMALSTENGLTPPFEIFDNTMIETQNGDIYGDCNTQLYFYWDFVRGRPSLVPTRMRLFVRTVSSDPSNWTPDGREYSFEVNRKFVLSIRDHTRSSWVGSCLGLPLKFWLSFAIMIQPNNQEILDDLS